ncbi:LamG domain-containing protein [Kribbella sandramycini]|uniref:LamG domain-containing protein n=1 Tax=Kribbella sandramycini TaxID=60450 RepID=A0A7Y4KX29_9ACTN|nr:LamG-like jellyroll fold domain-containing protein [Kribbella sandramycini]MBB6567808.1 hypothetical protein [Kribbella sandramycini]NOL39597.1 LamG domain-containing protein [Kribbella sandramycini]
MRVRRFMGALTTMAVAMAVVGQVAIVLPVAAQQPAATAPAGPTEVAELTTEDRIVHAQPDGSMVATLNVEPVRVKQAGRWNPVDTTLVRRPDGTFGPRAVPAELALSAGGTGPLVRLGSAAKSVELAWPGKLPAPTVRGDTATYSEVLPGVDLVMRAEARGYAQRLVVKNAQAAKNPALRRISFGLGTNGVSVKQAGSGALQAIDERGEPMFEAAPPSMWDAPEERPAETRKQAGVQVELAQRKLTLVPDAALLADPQAKFPLTIDPDWKTFSRAGWTKVFSGKPTTSYWNGGNDVDSWAKVGYCGFDFCNGIDTTRAYFQFDTSSLSGEILSAELRTKMVYSPSCSNGTQRHELWRAAKSINSGTTWNTRPDGQSLLDTRLAPFSYTGCGGYRPLGFDVGSSVNMAGLSTYMLKADHEDFEHRWDWRKYKASETKLTVKFNHPPRTPTNLHTDPPLPAPCKWCNNKRYIGAQSDIWLKATLSDPDGDQLKSIWTIEYGGGEIQTHGLNKSGLVRGHNLDLRDKNGKTITWKVHGVDTADRAGPSATAPAFAVDATRPAKPPTVSGLLYQEGDNLWHGGKGVPDTFTLGSNGVTDINHFEYRWTGETAFRKINADRLGGNAPLRTAPPKDGPMTLFVRSVDRAGNPSEERNYAVKVRPGNGALAHYAFEDETKNSAYLPDTLNDTTGVLSGTTSYPEGAVGLGLRLGADGKMTAWAKRDPVNPVKNLVRTDSSFTVSAWVKPADPAVAQTVLSQSGSATHGFRVGVENGRWVFAMPQSDSLTAAVDKLTGPVAAAGWTHVTARYTVNSKGDGGAMTLFVNGAESPAVTHNVRWHSAGEFAVGPFAGDVDEVKIWDRSLTTAEAQALLRQDNVQAAHWPFDETAGTTANNEVIGGDDAVLNLGASFGDEQPVDRGYLRLDGVDDHATPNAPQLRTDQSFSVSAWLSTNKISTTQAALSQDGASESGFVVSHQDDGRYTFTMPRTDTTGPAKDTVSSAALPKTASEWRHLVAVYDAATGRMSLYVNGKATTVTRPAATWNATGAFQIGRMMAGGTYAAPWSGKLDDVRVYHRAISGAEVTGLLAVGKATVGHWKLDGNAEPGGTTKGISPPIWTAGQSDAPDASDLAVKLDGAQKQYLEAPTTLNAGDSFAVVAWAKLDKAGSAQVAVSQDGSTNSTFSLDATPDSKNITRWTITRYSTTGAISRAFGPAVQVGHWTHLAGVYSRDPGKVDLYVNGSLEGTIAVAAPSSSSGPLIIGARKYAGQRDQYFTGAIDDVEVYARELFSEEIATMAGRDLRLRHSWPLNESGGLTAADSTAGLGGTVRGGATFIPGKSGNAIKLDGVDDSAGTAALTGLRTDKSFTVSAWVYLDGYRDGSSTMTAVSVDGVNTSKFRLGHRTDENNGTVCIDDPFMPCGEWLFELPKADRDDVATAAALTVTAAEVNKWVHLVGVYDQPSNRIWLYVNGMRVAQADMNTPWTHPTTGGNGGVQIGRGKINGSPAEHFRGAVDDPRLYFGALNHSRVSGLHNSYLTGDTGPGLAETVAGHWKLDDNELDSSDKERALTLAGTPEWRPGRDGSALWLSGDDEASSSGPLLETAAAFSVSGWANLQDKTVNRTAASLQGDTGNAMKVFYDKAKDRWAASVDAGGAVTTVYSTVPVRTDEWTHLAASYNPATNQLWLYLNGTVSAAKLTADRAVVASGNLIVGRATVNGAPGEFFKGGLDDVRAYAKAITASEARTLHDAPPGSVRDSWRFNDGTARDYSRGGVDLTLTGATIEDGGVDGKALRLASAGAHASGAFGVSTRDSFTASAWVKLTNPGAKPATVVSQDGVRNHGFALQYRPAAKNWAFMAFDRDADNAEPLLVVSNQPAAVNEWVHLAGVYDHAAAQLRLYVNGVLQGHQDGVTLWDAMDKLSIGRGKVNGQPADYFTGLVDEVQVGQGVLSGAEIAANAAWAPAPAGQLGRYVNAAGTWQTASTDAPPAGYRFESSLGMPAPAGAPNTKMLYGCRVDITVVTTDDPTCANGQYPLVGEIGLVYISPPAGVSTVPINRCKKAGVHFDSRWDSCEGQEKELVLGYALGYAPMVRYLNPAGDHDNGVERDHWSTVDGTPPGYRVDELQGYLPLSAADGQADVLSCRTGIDQHLSLSCDGAVPLGGQGRLFTDNVPEDLVGRAVFRCSAGTEKFLSVDDACEGRQVTDQLGYLLAVPPGGVEPTEN